MKIYSIITARTSSSRFPGKILKNINKENKSIDILIKRAKKIGDGGKLETYSISKLPKYLQENLKKYNNWID